ncbi:MAG: hypothetical protein ABH841_01475 [Candidatus Nealsonbacteria bacterium]
MKSAKNNIEIKNCFALVEILIVLGIFSILALIGIPAFKMYQSDLQLSGSLRELSIDLRYAGQLAITEQIDYGVVFFPDDHQYQIVIFGDSNEILKSKTLPQGISFLSITGFTNNEVVFNPYGAAKEQGIITLINTKQATGSVDVRPSGFIKIIK